MAPVGAPGTPLQEFFPLRVPSHASRGMRVIPESAVWGGGFFVPFGIDWMIGNVV